MATRADEMRDLVEGLVAGARSRVEAAQQRVEGEAARLAQGEEDAMDRALGFGATRTSVDGFIQDLKGGRVARSASDSADRLGAEAIRRSETADFLGDVRMSVNGIRVGVSDMLGSLLGARTEQTAADRVAREDADRSRRSDAADAAGGRRDEVSARAAGVAAELSGLAGDRGLAEQLWQQGVAVIRGVVGAPVVTKAAEQAAAERAASEKAASEKAASEKAAAEHKAAAEKAAAEKAAKAAAEESDSR
ncbi:MAG: hypothetical protein ACOYEV_14780 [Candidatus Nanopelagicales bacterium]